MSDSDDEDQTADLWSIHKELHSIAKQRIKAADFVDGEVIEYAPQAALEAVDQENLRQRLNGGWVGKSAYKLIFDHEATRYRIVPRD